MTLIEDGLSTELLEGARRRVLAQTAETRTAIADLQQQLRRIEREAELLDELVRVRRSESLPGPQEPPPVLDHSAAGGGALTSAVIDILATAGEPVHLQELLSRLRDRRITIPGKGAPANLISHIRANSEIARPARGMYALRAWGIDDYADSRPSRGKAKPRGAKTGRGRVTAKRLSIEPATRSSA